MVKLKKHKPTKDIKERVQKKKRFSKEIIITMIIASVMILSVFGIMFSSYAGQQEEEIHGDFEFVKTGQGWMTLINGEKQYFQYSPSDLEGLEVSSDVFSLLQSPVVVITFNPNSEQVAQMEAVRLELAQYLALNFGKSIVYGITEENSAYNLTYYTCANSTSTVPVIELRAVDENKIPEDEAGQEQEVGTSIYSEGSCVVLASRERDWLAVTERLAYGMFGVLE